MPASRCGNVKHRRIVRFNLAAVKFAKRGNAGSPRLQSAGPLTYGGSASVEAVSNGVNTRSFNQLVRRE